MWGFRKPPKPSPKHEERPLTDEELLALNGRLFDKMVTIDELRLMPVEDKEALAEKARVILREEALRTLCDTRLTTPPRKSSSPPSP